LLDPDRVNLFERWESQAALKAFRRKAPRNTQRAAMLSVSVAEYDIADARPFFGKGKA
jgi:quinol monooxygenase YgiN